MALEIRRLRQDAGLTQAEVAKVLECQVPKVSLMESAQRQVQESDLRQLLDLYEVPEDRHEQYFEAAKSMRRRGWWERYVGEPTVPPWFELFLGLEQGASRLRSFQPAVFHSLLQIPNYAAATLRSQPTSPSEEIIERIVSLRTRRQEALWRESEPLRLWAVVDEAVLHRQVGGKETMAAQLAHVIDIVSRNPNIILQVVPFIRGAYDASYGPFAILSFPWPTDPGVVYLEHRSGAEYLEALPEIDAHSHVFQHLCGQALSPDESLDMVRTIAESYT